MRNSGAGNASFLCQHVMREPLCLPRFNEGFYYFLQYGFCKLISHLREITANACSKIRNNSYLWLAYSLLRNYSCFMLHITRTKITSLRDHLRKVDATLYALREDTKTLPSPAEMKALSEIRVLLKTLPGQAELCETECWKRIQEWQNTPYTPRQQAIRSVSHFIGWWIVGTMAVSYSVMNWFAAFFPKPWYSLVISMMIALLGTLIATYKNYRCSKQ